VLAREENDEAILIFFARRDVVIDVCRKGAARARDGKPNLFCVVELIAKGFGFGDGGERIGPTLKVPENNFSSDFEVLHWLAPVGPAVSAAGLENIAPSPGKKSIACQKPAFA
jgi:hypothetical protein